MLTTTQPGNLERAQSVTIGDTYTFGPGDAELGPLHVQPPARRSRTDGRFRSIRLSSGVNMYSAVPNFLLLTITDCFSTFCGTCAPGHFNVNSFQVADDVDVIRGKHQIAFGFNFIRVQNNTVSGFNENGNFTFNGSDAPSLAGWPTS